MAHTGPGKSGRKSGRKGISFKRLLKMFPNDDAACKWFEARIWPKGPHCPYCGSLNVQCNIKHRSMTHRCRDCNDRPMFSLKIGNIMEGSKLGYQTWAIAIYLVTTSLKGVSSMKLHRDLEITQKSAWHLAHRLRRAFEASTPLFEGPVEVDETYIGGKRKNMPKAKRMALKGRGGTGKTVVAGVKDRATNDMSARVVSAADRDALHGFVKQRAAVGGTVYTDDAAAYAGMADMSRRSTTRRASTFGAWRTRTALNHSGRCSSADTRARFTTSPKSTPIAMLRSSRGATTCARSIPSIRWRPSPGKWSESGCGIGNWSHDAGIARPRFTQGTERREVRGGSCRPAVAVHKSDRQGGTGASATIPVRHSDP